ncbi:hypothetical protein D3C79_786750 [compost metagenome]
MLCDITHPRGGVTEVLLQQPRIAAIQFQLLGCGQWITVQDINASAQAALGITRAVDQAQPAGGSQDVECAGDGLARRLLAAGAGGQIRLQVLIPWRFDLALGDEPAQHLPRVALQRGQSTIKE